MTTYTIYLMAKPIACVSGTEYAYAVFAKAVGLAELIGGSCDLVWDETGEIVAHYHPDEM